MNKNLVKKCNFFFLGCSISSKVHSEKNMMEQKLIHYIHAIQIFLISLLILDACSDAELFEKKKCGISTLFKSGRG